MGQKPKSKFFVLTATIALLLAMLAVTANGADTIEAATNRDLDENRDYDDDEQSWQEAKLEAEDRRMQQTRMMRKALAEYEQSVTEQVANLAEMIPLSEYFRMKVRILKLGEFNNMMLEWIKRDMGVKPPLHQVALVIMFIVGSYIPMLLATIVYSMTCKKEVVLRFDPSMYTYNKPDSVQISKILEQIVKIQSSVTKLQQATDNGDDLADGTNDRSSAETDQILGQTQNQLQHLGSSLQTMQMRQDQQSKKLEEMDRRIQSNFSIMFDQLSKKIEEQRVVSKVPNYSSQHNPATITKTSLSEERNSQQPTKTKKTTPDDSTSAEPSLKPALKETMKKEEDEYDGEAGEEYYDEEDDD